MKALVTERYLDWRQRLAPLNLSCAEITGDTEYDDITVIRNSEVRRVGCPHSSLGFIISHQKKAVQGRVWYKSFLLHWSCNYSFLSEGREFWWKYDLEFLPLCLFCTSIIVCFLSFQVILTTPEKWDFLTRRWRDHASLMQAISLLLIDEVRPILVFHPVLHHSLLWSVCPSPLLPTPHAGACAEWRRSRPHPWGCGVPHEDHPCHQALAGERWCFASPKVGHNTALTPFQRQSHLYCNGHTLRGLWHESSNQWYILYNFSAPWTKKTLTRRQ